MNGYGMEPGGTDWYGVHLVGDQGHFMRLVWSGTAVMTRQGTGRGRRSTLRRATSRDARWEFHERYKKALETMTAIWEDLGEWCDERPSSGAKIEAQFCERWFDVITSALAEPGPDTTWVLLEGLGSRRDIDPGVGCLLGFVTALGGVYDAGRDRAVVTSWDGIDTLTFDEVHSRKLGAWAPGDNAAVLSSAIALYDVGRVPGEVLDAARRLVVA